MSEKPRLFTIIASWQDVDKTQDDYATDYTQKIELDIVDTD